MAPLGSTNYQQILAQANQQVQQLLSLTGTDSIGGEKFSISDVNSLFSLSESVGQLVDGEDSQKASAINNIVNKISSLLSGLGKNDVAEANKKTKENEKKINENDQEAAATSQKVDTQLQDILNQCLSGQKSIETALEKIAELGGDKGKIKEAETQLQAELQIIEDNKKILNNPETESKERLTAIKAILGAVSAINSLVESVNEYSEQIQEQNTIVESTSENLATLSTNATEILTNGINDIKTSMQKAGILTTENTQMAVDGTQKEVTGKVEETVGEGMTKFAPTAAEGTKHIIGGQNRMQAGTTLMQGSVKGLSKLTQSIGTYENYLGAFTNFANGIGEFTTGAMELIGQYDTTVNPMITSIGSWETIADANKELEQYANDYAAEVGVSDQDVMEDAGFAAANSFMNSQTTAWTRGVTAQEEQGNESKEIMYKEFTFDTSVFKIEE